MTYVNLYGCVRRILPKRQAGSDGNYAGQCRESNAPLVEGAHLRARILSQDKQNDCHDSCNRADNCEHRSAYLGAPIPSSKYENQRHC